MKRNIFTLFFVMMLIIASCGKPESAIPQKLDPTPTQIVEDPIVIEGSTDTKPTFSDAGGKSTVKFTAKASWTASIINTKADSWVSLDKDSGGAGEITLTITVEKNETPDERNATVQIKSEGTTISVVVTQKQKDAITLTPSKTEIEAVGGTFTVEVKANIDFSYVIAESCKGWISLTETKALKTNVLTFTVAENVDLEKREGLITIKSSLGEEEIKVYQSAATPSIILTQNEYSIGPVGGNIQVEIKSNVSVSVVIPSECDWITEVVTKSVSTNTYSFAIAENMGETSRNASISFNNNDSGLSESIKIVQSERNAVLQDDYYYGITIEGGTIEIPFKANSEFEIEIVEGVDWISIVETKTYDDHNIILGIAPYVDGNYRRGIVKVKVPKNEWSDGLDLDIDGLFFIHQYNPSVFAEIPDPAFMTYLQSMGYDRDGDGKINLFEAGCIDFVGIFDKSVSSLKGIEYFPNLTTLMYTWDYNHDMYTTKGPLTELDISHNQKLETLYCEEHQISSLDFSNNPSLRVLEVSGNPIGTINIANLSELSSIDVSYCNLRSLAVSSCPNLRSLECKGNSLGEIDLSQCPELTGLICGDNQISSLDVRANTKLENLQCNNNQLGELTLSNNVNIKSLGFDDNNLTEINLSTLSALEILSCRNNQLSSLDFSNNLNLYGLACDGNIIQSLELSGFNFGYLHCARNLLSSLDLSQMTNMVELDCSENRLSLLRLPEGAEMHTINCSHNNIAELILPQYNGLWSLNCSYNQLTELNVNSCKSFLNELICNDNQITSLSLVSFPNLRTVNAENNCFENVEVSNCPSLYRLDAFSSDKCTVDLTSSHELSWLRISGNIDEIDLSQNRMLSKVVWVTNIENKPIDVYVWDGFEDQGWLILPSANYITK